MYKPLLFQAKPFDITRIHESLREEDAEFERVNDHARKHNTYVGRTFGVPHADGKAMYQVIGETARSYKVAWLAIGDAWRDHYFDGGGMFPKARVEKFLKADDAFHKIFQGVH
jgi:hypothetical protein